MLASSAAAAGGVLLPSVAPLVRDPFHLQVSIVRSHLHVVRRYAPLQVWEATKRAAVVGIPILVEMYEPRDRSSTGTEPSLRALGLLVMFAEMPPESCARLVLIVRHFVSLPTHPPDPHPTDSAALQDALRRRRRKIDYDDDASSSSCSMPSHLFDCCVLIFMTSIFIVFGCCICLCWPRLHQHLRRRVAIVESSSLPLCCRPSLYHRCVLSSLSSSMGASAVDDHCLHGCFNRRLLADDLRLRLSRGKVPDPSSRVDTHPSQARMRFFLGLGAI